MNQLYERIRVLCEEKNITIGELSRRAKLNDDDRQALKRGRRMNISLGAAKNIARVLGVSIDVPQVEAHIELAKKMLPKVFPLPPQMRLFD